MKHSMSKSKSSILIIDEPGSGLDNTSAYHAISYIREKSANYKSIIVIDHKEVILRECDYTFQFGPGSGPDGGYILYNGPYQKHASNN